MSGRQKNLKRKATEAAELKAKRAKGETDLMGDLKWEYVGEVVKHVCPLIVLSSSSLPGRQKIVGFDIDFTVIKTASGRRFASGEHSLMPCTNHRFLLLLLLPLSAGPSLEHYRTEYLQGASEARLKTGKSDLKTDKNIPQLYLVVTGQPSLEGLQGWRCDDTLW